MTRDRYVYPAGLYDPNYQPELGETMFQSLDRITERFPDREALVDRDRRLTFRQYRACAARLAAQLHHLGLKFGDRVVSILPVWAEASFGWYAASAIGAVWVPLSLAFRERELRYILGNIEPKAVIVVDSFGGFNYLEAVTELLRDFPCVRRVLVKGQATAGALSVDDLMAEDPGVGDELTWVRRLLNPSFNAADTLCLITHTSGTTGEPKGAMHTHNTVLSNCKSAAKVSRTTEDDVFLQPLPMSHQFGVESGTAYAFVGGAKVVLLDSFEPRRYLETIQRERATFLVGVPTMFRLALTHPDFDKFDVSSVRAGYVGGAASDPGDRVACIERLGEVMHIGGMTEASMSTIVPFDAPMEIKARSIGRVIPGGQAKVVDETGGTAPTGELGELWLTGPNITPGYWNKPEVNAEKFSPDGWLKTGDIGRMDAEGYIYLVSRVDDRIVRGGHKIYPVEVEGLLSSHPKIAQCCIVGVANPVLGECTVACIKLKAGESLDIREVRDFCRGKIAEYLVPDFVEIVDSIPLSPTGKILYKLVRKAVEGKYAGQRPPK
ncbi:MAG: class I adenylate-forming enzyme family protein [Dehalococcoidia bacterium]|nr:class I adenylate-forming enzyme family protein [Dehalococcoidia bacterium]